MVVYIIFRYIFLRLANQSQIIPLQNVVYFIKFPFLVRKIFTFYTNDLLLFKCPIPGPKGYRCLRTGLGKYDPVTSIMPRHDMWGSGGITPAVLNECRPVSWTEK